MIWIACSLLQRNFAKFFSLFTFLLHGIFRSSIFQKITVKG
jgi:hypothetical protein